LVVTQDVSGRNASAQIALASACLNIVAVLEADWGIVVPVCSSLSARARTPLFVPCARGAAERPQSRKRPGVNPRPARDEIDAS
jgi:hypothetical protein